MKTITTGSDFSGVGAFDYAIERVATSKGFRHKRIYACDWDKYARITYAHNHGMPEYYPEDVYEREIPVESLDIFMTSPPCQAFSLAGNRKGEDDERGVLFYNSHDFIIKNKPRFFIFENVKGLLSDENGRTFQTWIDYLGGKSVNGMQTMFPDENSAPYHIYHKVINSKDHGVPQNRERIFIVGIRDDEDNNFRFPKEEFLTTRLKDVLESDVDEKYFLSDKMVTALQNHQVFNKFNPTKGEGVASCITARLSKMGNADNYIKDVIKIIGNTNPSGRGMNGNVFDENGISPTLSTNKGEGIKVKSATKKGYGFKIRRLTPRECFRLQDFPESFDFSVVSNSQAYKQAGNSITVRVLEKIINNLNL